MTRANRRVLIADDNAHLRELVSVTLDSDEYELLQAADGDEAWRLIEQCRPDVALLDVLMPGRSGLELARAIKSNPLLASTRVILLTAKASDTDVAAGLAAGADLYLTKPFSPLKLLAAVEQALGLA